MGQGWLQGGTLRVIEGSGELVAWRRTGAAALRIFMAVWLAGWTVACVMLVRQVLREPTPEHVLFGVPFWVGWVGAAVILPWLWLGFERLRVGPDGVEYRWGVVADLGGRLVPLGEVRGVGRFARAVNDAETPRVEHGLLIETAGRPVRFGLGLDETERDRLTGLVLQHLRAAEPGQTFTGPSADDDGGEAVATAERLEPGRAFPDPPSDVRVTLSPDWDGVVLTRRGRFHPGTLAAATLMALFWNAIVGVFLLQLRKAFDMHLFVFLIPFEGVGLLLVGFWWCALLAPFGAERWTVGPGGVTRRLTVFGLGWTRRVDPKEVGGVELRKAAAGAKPSWGSAPDEDAPYTLALVGRDGGDLLRFKRLTEGEARWAGAVVLEALKGKGLGGGWD